MRRAIATLALALSLIGCGSPPSPIEPFEPVRLTTSWEPGAAGSPSCRPGWWAAGRLVVDPTHGTAMMVESGDYHGPKDVPMPVLWWPTVSARRIGNDIAVISPDGKVMAMTGRRYRIEGSFERVGFVACTFENSMPRPLDDGVNPP
jgi:hypothetical protein